MPRSIHIALIPCLMVAALATAQTPVEGRIETNTTWTIAGSPYVLTGDVEVVGGATLSIDDGVRVAGREGARLVIGGDTPEDPGTLLVLGGTRPVRFYEHEFRGTWDGILFRPGAVPAEFDEGGAYRGGSLIRGAEIDDAMRPITMDQTYAYLENVDVLIGFDDTRAAVLIDLPRTPAVEMRASNVSVKSGLGGGMRINYGGRKVLTDCVFEENYAVGLLVWSLSTISRDSTHIMNRCTFRDNENRSGRETDGGGAWLVGHGDWQVVDCVFENNTSSRNGGGALIEGSQSILVRGCRFEGNHAPNSGGGIDIGSRDMAVEDCQFVANTAGTSAGGALATINSTATTESRFSRTRFEDNRAGKGGALTIFTALETIEECEFLNNQSTTDGGAIRFIGYARQLLLTRSRFIGNATAGVGGALSMLEACFPDGADVVSTSFEDNSARLGGAMYTTQPTDVHTEFNFASESDSPNTFRNNTAQLGDNIYHASPVDIDATGVCWGVSLPAAIANRIHDGRDESGLGIVSFDPVATTCDTCRTDLDGDGALTLFDYLAFTGLFGLGDLQADFDGDGALTIFDFLVYQTEFDAGCG